MSDTTIRRPVRWLSASATDVGMVRQINEDAVFSKISINLWAVADGMGGHEAGEIASNMIVKVLDEIEMMDHLNSYVVEIENIIHDVNDQLLEYSEIILEGRIVGSTVAILLIKGRVGVCMWAGDSRLYRYRNESLSQISMDHSHVAELIQRGSISAEEAENHPDANVITRAVGTCENLYVDIDVFDVGVGDTFLLCTDGLYNALNEAEIAKCLQNENLDLTVDNLVETALHNNAADNVSVVVVKGVRSDVNHIANNQ